MRIEVWNPREFMLELVTLVPVSVCGHDEHRLHVEDRHYLYSCGVSLAWLNAWMWALWKRSHRHAVAWFRHLSSRNTYLDTPTPTLEHSIKSCNYYHLHSTSMPIFQSYFFRDWTASCVFICSLTLWTIFWRNGLVQVTGLFSWFRDFQYYSGHHQQLDSFLFNKVSIGGNSRVLRCQLSIPVSENEFASHDSKFKLSSPPALPHP